MKIIIQVLFIILFSVNSVMCQDNNPTLKNNTFIMATIRPDTQHFGKWQRLVYTDLFKRLGIKVEYKYFPAKRATSAIDAGKVDGEPARPYKYANDHKNLIRIEESIFDVSYTAFTANTSIPQLSGWESLKGKNYKVEHRRGIKICESNLPKVVINKNLSNVTNSSQGLKKLIIKRTDLFIDEETGILTLLQSPEFKNSNIRIAGIMKTFPVYSYIHKKNAFLVPKMNEIIKIMKTEGIIEQYRTQS